MTVVRKIMQPLHQKTHNLTLNIKKGFHSTFGKRNFTHLTTDVMLSGQRFAILAMFIGAQLIRTGLELRSLKGAPAVHFNLPLLSFYLYTTFKSGIAAACESIPLE